MGFLQRCLVLPFFSSGVVGDVALWLVTDWVPQLAPLFSDVTGVRVLAPEAVTAAVAAHGPPRWVVHWSRRVPQAISGSPLNSPAGVALLGDSLRVKECLALNGLTVFSPGGLRDDGTVIYRVGIFDLQVYGVQRAGPRSARWRGRRPLLWRQWERITGTALRALHSLGLDSAVVSLAVGSGAVRDPAVAGIRLGPLLGGQAAVKLKQLLVQRVAGAGEGGAIRLGADPEFMLRHRSTGHMVAASHFFSRYGAVGCDTQSGTTPGEYPVAELRPAARTHPERLLAEIRRCLALAARQGAARELEWLAGAHPFARFPTGGHIHFSGLPLSGSLLRALDTYLAVPVFMVEPQEAAVERRRQHGFLGDVRLKRHGGFEYRTLPSWLVDPAVTRGVLHLAWLVARGHRRLSLHLFQDLTLQEAFYRGDQAPFRRWLPALWDDLSKLPDFPASRRALAPLQEMAAAGARWDDGSDFRTRWRLPGSTVAPLTVGGRWRQTAGA